MVAVRLILIADEFLLVADELPVLVQPHEQHLEAVVYPACEPVVVQLQDYFEVDVLHRLLRQVDAVLEELLYELEELLLLKLVTRFQAQDLPQQLDVSLLQRDIRLGNQH